MNGPLRFHIDKDGVLTHSESGDMIRDKLSPNSSYISITEIEGKTPLTVKCDGCDGVLFREFQMITFATSNDSYTDFYCKTCNAVARVRLHVEMVGEQLP